MFPLLSFLLCEKNMGAQEVGTRFIISAAELYSPRTEAQTFELSAGYLFGRGGVKIIYNNIGLHAGTRVHGESVSLFMPAFNAHSFAMIPEVSAGIVHGHIGSAGDNGVKAQVQIGVSLSYSLSRQMSCGIICRSFHCADIVIPMFGWCYSLHF